MIFLMTVMIIRMAIPCLLQADIIALNDDSAFFVIFMNSALVDSVIPALAVQDTHQSGSQCEDLIRHVLSDGAEVVQDGFTVHFRACDWVDLLEGVRRRICDYTFALRYGLSFVKDRKVCRIEWLLIVHTAMIVMIVLFGRRHAHVGLF